MIFSAENGKYSFKQLITPRVLEISLAIFKQRDPQFMNSFNADPRNLKKNLSIRVLLISSSGISRSVIRSSDNDSTGLRPPGSLHTLGADGHI